MVLRETSFLIFIGLAIGIPAAVLSGRLIKSRLYGLEPSDPFTLAAAAIAASTLVMIAISAAGPNVSVPAMRRAAGPPWWHALHLTATFVTVSLWAAMALGCAGVIAGLVAVARGARPPVRPLPRPRQSPDGLRRASPRHEGSLPEQ